MNSRLAIGTAQFGLDYGVANQSGQIDHLEARAMIQYASDCEIHTIDTAIAYGDSEFRLGEIGVVGFDVVSKLPALPSGCIDAKSWIRQQVSLSLSRLGVSKLYALLLHHPSQLQGPNGVKIYNTLLELKQQNYVQKIGISVYSPGELDIYTQLFHFDLIQAPFNLVDRRLSSSGWMERLQSNGIEIHTRSAFLQGLLLMEENLRPTKFSRWTDLWQIWHSWLREHDLSAIQACLSFCLSFPEISKVIVGADSVSQLSQIVGAAKCRHNIKPPTVQSGDENLINPINWQNL